MRREKMIKTLTTKLLVTFFLFFTFLAVTALPVYALHPDCEIGDPGIADLEDQIECAIVKGLEYISGHQQAGGEWNDGYGNLAGTGLMCVKYFDRADDLGQNPYDSTEFMYAANLINAINYIASHLISGDSGELRADNSSYRTYSTGIAAMCFAAAAKADGTRTATTGAGVRTYAEILQGLLNWVIGNQQTGGCAEGGWYYREKEENPTWGDNSISGYATMGLGFGQSLSAVAIPAAALSHLDVFINTVQHSSSDAYDGGSRYGGPLGSFPNCSSGYDWINALKTGNLLYEICLVEPPETSTRVDRALTFLETFWTSTAGQSNGGGWIGNYQAMFTMMKGLQGCGIDLLNLDGGSDRDDEWFDEVAQWIVNDQEPDGSFVQDTGRGNTIVNAGWALLTLEKGVPIISTPYAIMGELSVILHNGAKVTSTLDYQADVASNGIFRAGTNAYVEGEVSSILDFTLRDGAKMNKSIVTGGNLTLLRSTFIGEKGDAREDALLGPGARIMDTLTVSLTSNVKLGKKAYVGGGIIYGVPREPVEVILPTCTCTPPASSSDVPVQTGPNEFTVPPGDYDEPIAFADGVKVIFPGGEYHFESLKFGINNYIELQNPVVFHVVTGLNIGNGTRMSLTSGDPKKVIYRLGDNALAKTGTSSLVIGTLCGPTAEVILRDGSRLEGAVYAKSVLLGINGHITVAPAARSDLEP